MPIKYIPFIPEPVEGQAVLSNFNRILKYKGADDVSMVPAGDATVRDGETGDGGRESGRQPGDPWGVRLRLRLSERSGHPGRSGLH